MQDKSDARAGCWVSGHHAAKVNAEFDDNVTVVERHVEKEVTVEIQEYNNLGSLLLGPEALFFLRKAGRKLKRARIVLNGGEFRAESHALHYLVGKVEIDVETGGVTGIAKKLLKGALTNVTPIQPRYFGHGEVYLEPTWGHYALCHLNDEEAIVDKGIYHASAAAIHVDVFVTKNIKTAAIGETGIFCVKLKGTGWVLLKLPVPPTEVHKIPLRDDCVKVEGEAVVLRKGQVEYTMQRSVKSFVRSVASGETYLHCYKGTGEVWLLPTYFMGSNNGEA